MSSDDPNARRGDPETSRAAGAAIRAEKAADRARVHVTYFDRHPTPLADFQMEEILGGAQNGRWRKRRSDLTDDGVLIPIDKVINPHTKKWVTRWGLADTAIKPVAPPLLSLMAKT